ncbi:MAG: hypothetical protein HXY43_02000 [Fischerella sp.]|jgi:hypothetical protein|uniref:hypothetical protein n=1 Tax=Fischerella sp. TaxID=1191 RepID=UPI0018381309|nr:hypothetical protein [Fischerella sp.]NWF58107.1 hypothetical protein [Fischerella sp.]
MRKAKWLTVSIAVVVGFSSFNKPNPANANPGVLAPAAPLCATGVGTVVCAVLGVVTLGGVVYYVVNSGGEKKVIDSQGNTLMNIEDLVIKKDDKGQEYVEVNTLEECKLVKPALGREVKSWQYKDGKVRCMLFPENKRVK